MNASPEIRIHADLSPDAGVAVALGGLFLPGVVAELAGTGNRVEDPQTLAGSDVESAHVAFDVVFDFRRAGCPVRGADDHHIAGHHGRRVQPDFAGFEIDHLIVIELQIDDAVLPEARNRNAGLGVERDQPIARRDVENPFVIVRSTQYARPRPESCRGAFVPRAPSSSLCVHSTSPVAASRRRRPARSRGRVQNSLDHQRRRLQIGFRTRTEVVGLEPPGDLQLIEIAPVDLIERRIVRVCRGPRRRYATRRLSHRFVR